MSEVNCDLSQADYDLFRKLVYAHSGISLGEGKRQLVRARLGRVLRSGAFGSYREYYDFVESDVSGRAIIDLLDAVCTNTTQLFRESKHFEFLAEVVQAWAAAATARRFPILRVWSAGCSSGEEPYTIAMTLDHALQEAGELQFRILATDLSTRALERAASGEFSASRVAHAPLALRRHYFERVRTTGEPRYRVVERLRRRVRFARLNLIDQHFPFRNALDAIFCRNVMIYFDRETQQGLVSRFEQHLRPGGLLFLGHSESLTRLKHGLAYVRPTVYQRPAPDGCVEARLRSRRDHVGTDRQCSSLIIRDRRTAEGAGQQCLVTEKSSSRCRAGWTRPSPRAC